MYVCLSDVDKGCLQFQVACHCSPCGFNISWTVHWLTSIQLSKVLGLSQNFTFLKL